MPYLHGFFGPVVTTLGVHLREITVTILSLGIVGAAIYDLLANGEHHDQVLQSWAALVVGVYFGAHIADGEGRRILRKREEQR